ncbi:MAG: aminoglycoside phosphotransferase family protein [bacterium]
MTLETPALTRDHLGDDLWTLLRALPSPPIAIESLSGVGYPGYQPTAFRIALADGRVVKALRATSEEQAVLVHAVSSRLDARRFAAVLARAGATLLTEWVDGPPLRESPGGDADAREAGDLLGALHQLALQPHEQRPAAAMLGDCTARLRKHLGQLVERGGLAASERDAALQFATAHAPAGCTVGLIHRDLCPENLARRAGGGLCVIDLETMGVGVCEYDLGRTWYRWPMPASGRQAFHQAYTVRRDAGAFLAHAPFWILCATATSAVLRIRKHPDGAEVPVERLRGVLQQLHAGASPERIALEH